MTTEIEFSSLRISAQMHKALNLLKYTQMTPIQSKVLPYILDKKDILAQAETGTGKTVAFGIGVLSKLDLRLQHIQGLILCPTRELAAQISHEMRRLAIFMPNVRVLTLCGGKPFNVQVASLERRVHIVVGTPGRILDHIQRGTLQVTQINTLVLDEADRMLDLGFYATITEIIQITPKQRQTLLFSATYPKAIKKISNALQNKPVEISLSSTPAEQGISQLFYPIKESARDATLLALLQHYQAKSVIIFCNTKIKCAEILNKLTKAKFTTLAIHGDLEQREREQILIQFSNNSCTILVATDVAARGLDIDNIEIVINYELSGSPEVHIHRIGRTGRAGNSGLALSLFVAAERHKLQSIEDYQQQPLNYGTVESLTIDPNYQPQANMVTLCLNGGKKQKLRAGDILGALTSSSNIVSKQVGKINIGDYYSYVAIERTVAPNAVIYLREHKIKGKSFKIYIV
jgi:ATP-independent RNA helicase DbpA